MSKRDFCFAYFNLEKYVITDHNAAASTADRSKTQCSACVVRSCKGCLRCVEVCPTNALVTALEKDYPEKPHFLPNQHLLPDAIRYQTVGANSWITSDSFTDEKRVDGGVV